MALHYYFGGAGSGKSTALYQEIIDRSLKEPRRSFLVIVPEQFNMAATSRLIALHPNHGIFNIDVLSFERLAHRVFDEVGLSDRQLLQEIGKTFILTKVAIDRKKSLGFLGENLVRTGNLAEMKSMISELMLYGISPDKLTAGEGDKSTLLDRKLGDINTVYRGFLDYMEERGYMTAEEVPDVLARVADASRLLEGAVIAFDGFTGFTPVQLTLVEKLMRKSSDLYVTVTMDVTEDGRGLHARDRFTMSREMTTSLDLLAKKTGTAVAPPVFLTPEAAAERKRPALAHLERNLFKRGAAPWEGDQTDVRLLALANPLTEIRETARLIEQMIREGERAGEPLRYRDFAIITGDMATYGNYVRQVFGAQGIPYFLDEKRPLIHNPFVEYVRAALEACADGYSYESMFRMLRTGMSGLPVPEIDILENYVIALGIRGKERWRRDWLLAARDQDPAQVPVINEIRKKVLALIDPLSEALADRGGTIRTKTLALYDFCVRSGCGRRLEEEGQAYAEKGRGDLAKEYAQVYRRVMNFLDKLVGVLGDEKASMADYRAICEAGFAEEKLGIIPPGTDQVQVGDMERSRLSSVKVLFFVGVNEGVVPKAPESGGLLTEIDRERLRERGITLKPSPREAIEISRFYLYLALAKPTRRLYLTYALSSSDGSVIRPAYLTGTIRRMFPSIETEEAPADLADRVERPEAGLYALAEEIGALKGEEPSPAFRQLYAWYAGREDYRPRLRSLLAAAATHYEPDEIGAAAARALYGRKLENSASRLERFSACAFAHFAQYGLRLKERQVYVFSGADMGNVVHTAFEMFARALRERGLRWADIDDDTRNSLVKASVEEAAEAYNNQLLHNSVRNEYNISRMERLMANSAWAMQEQLRRGDFEPAYFEVPFHGNESDAAYFKLPDGTRMDLTGRIDRVDICEDEGRTFLKVIDYKTGSKAFDLTEVYYGLQLQLVVYMNAACEMVDKSGERSGKAEPAGIFYYEIKDPVEDVKPGDTDEDVRSRLLKKMKASGIVSLDEDAIRHLDRTLSAGNRSSDVIPIEYTRDGRVSAKSRAVTPEDFGLISSYVDRKIYEIGSKIMAGEAAVNPYEFHGRDACEYCSLRGLCGFDQRIGGYRKRQLKAFPSEEVLEKMREEQAHD